MKVKIIILTMLVVMLTGCATNIKHDNDSFYDIVIDTDTCVEYLYHDGGYAESFKVRINADGTPKLNGKCLENNKEKGDKE